jgi:hypothetical protein
VVVWGQVQREEGGREGGRGEGGEGEAQPAWIKCTPLSKGTLLQVVTICLQLHI